MSANLPETTSWGVNSLKMKALRQDRQGTQRLSFKGMLCFRRYEQSQLDTTNTLFGNKELGVEMNSAR